ncbi:MAG: hypothetical protein J6T74_09200 [Clostridia bacterium]|nr:hypothetical protein [Clostridia bacterium]
MLIIGTSFLTNKKIMEKYTKLIKNNNPNSYSIKNFNNYVININIYRILIWCFYVIAVVINSLIKLNLICIENEKWIFLFESAECCAIVSIAIAGLAQVIDKHLKIIQKIDGEK